MRGLEIGPWFAPLAPKKGGYNCLAVDVFDADTLRERARNNRNVPDALIPDIEDVDVLGSSTEIASLVEARGELGTHDYIISSHNFEHLPNPIKFLQGCSQVLKVNGMLSMAIPDKRACFDYFRPHSTISQIIDAYFEDRRRPTFAQEFDQLSLHSLYRRGADMHLAFTLHDDPIDIIALRNLDDGYSGWVQRRDNLDETYADVHCWVFTPTTFELIIRDLQFLGLSQFEIMELDSTGAGEFVIHMRNVGGRVCADRDRFYEEREVLLRRIGCELAENSLVLRSTRAQVAEREGEIARLKQVTREVESEAARLKQVTEKIEGEAARLRHAMEEIKNSTSWRLTEPMRQIVGLVRAVGAVCRIQKRAKTDTSSSM